MGFYCDPLISCCSQDFIGLQVQKCLKICKLELSSCLRTFEVAIIVFQELRTDQQFFHVSIRSNQQSIVHSLHYVLHSCVHLLSAISWILLSIRQTGINIKCWFEKTSSFEGVQKKFLLDIYQYNSFRRLHYGSVSTAEIPNEIYLNYRDKNIT